MQSYNRQILCAGLCNWEIPDWVILTTNLHRNITDPVSPITAQNLLARLRMLLPKEMYSVYTEADKILRCMAVAAPLWVIRANNLQIPSWHLIPLADDNI